MRTFTIGIGIGLAAIGWGCGSDPASDQGSWYDESREHSGRRAGYVGSQQELGVTELDAKREWERDQMIGNTLGSWRSVSSQGDGLDEIVDP